MLGFLLSTFLFGAVAWPQSPAADLVKRGNDYASKGDYSHAIEAYTESIRLNPGSPTTFYARGRAYHRNHDDDRAIQDYTAAIRLAPDYGEAFRERGHAYEDKNDYAHAIQDYTEAMRLRPGDIHVQYARAFDYERKGEYEPAIADLTEIIHRFPQAADAYRNRGQAQMNSGHLSEAQQDLSRAVELDRSGQYNVIWLYIARAKAKASPDDELAKNAAKLDLTKWPGPIIQLFLGESTPEAVLQAASDKDSQKNKEQQCEANFYIAKYHAVHGQRSAALEGFRSVSESCPKNYFFYVPAARAELGNELP
ncbi:MAG TPA: tetratricopeptide repeat protein [Candidatus Angelobacter sp.]